MADPQKALQSNQGPQGGAPARVAGIENRGDSARLQSAELLAHEPGGGAVAGGAASQPAKPMEQHQLHSIGLAYQQMGVTQARAVRNVKGSVGEKDPPPLVDTLLLTLCAAAVAGAVGMVAQFVAIKFAERIKLLGLSATAGQIFTEGVKSATKGFVDGALQGAWARATKESRNPIEIFFRVQEAVLEKASHDMQMAFSRLGEAALKGQSFEAVEALLEAAIATGEVAYDVQFNQTLDAWVSYLARASQGAAVDGPKWMADAMQSQKQAETQGKDEDTETVGAFLGTATSPRAEDAAGHLGSGFLAGVLRLDVGLGRHDQPPQIWGARLSGLNEKLRAQVANRPIKDLKMPIVVHARCASGTVHVGRNEAGTTWNQSNDGGNEWLYRRAGALSDWRDSEAAARENRPAIIECGLNFFLDKDLGPLSVGTDKMKE